MPAGDYVVNDFSLQCPKILIPEHRFQQCVRIGLRSAAGREICVWDWHGNNTLEFSQEQLTFGRWQC